jgi:hypothetical protein
VPIDPTTGKPGAPITVDDPYNLFFTPDGSSAVVVVEAFKKLEFRDPKNFALQTSIAVAICRGMNHGNYSADFSFMFLTCKFNGMPNGLTGRKNQTCGVELA